MHTDLAREVLSDAVWWATGVYSPAVDWRSSFRAGPFRHSVEIPERGIRLILEGEGEEPAWVVPTLNALVEALALPDNWDSYGAYRVDLKCFEPALQALRLAMRGDTLPPTVVPTVRGGIQFEWHTRGIDLEIEISPTGHPYVSYVNRRDETEWEGELNFNLGRLRDVMLRLSHHP
jgi:hypothetical protein